jgi:hypothetical protein
MRENNLKVKSSACKVMAIVFWDTEGLLLVEFLKRGATLNSDQYVQTLKKLKRQIRKVRPNRKMNQVFILPTVPI